MPKEMVFGSEPILGTRESPEVEGLVEVLWYPESDYVGLTTRTRACITHDTLETGPYINLDRRKINELIKGLRRARDRAYGRDE